MSWLAKSLVRFLSTHYDRHANTAQARPTLRHTKATSSNIRAAAHPRLPGAAFQRYVHAPATEYLQSGNVDWTESQTVCSRVNTEDYLVK